MIRADNYRAGEMVITEGQRGGEAFVVERGRVEVFRAGPPPLRLAVLGPGQIFGEMALITELPRSASVRALDDAEVSVIDGDDFLDHLRTNSEALLPVLRTMAERIRNLNAFVGELAQKSPGVRDAMRAHLGIDAPVDGHETMPASLRVTVKGITPMATGVLDNGAMTVDRFPFRIGRRTSANDPFTSNELAIPDESPWWISRNHCMLSHVDGRCFLIDRGSRLGTFVDGRMVGGSMHAGRLELSPGEHEVRLGGALTPFRFAVTIGAPQTTPRRGRAKLAHAGRNGRRKE